MASQLVPVSSVFLCYCCAQAAGIFASVHALVHGVVFNRKQPPIAAVDGGLWKR